VEKKQTGSGVWGGGESKSYTSLAIIVASFLTWMSLGNNAAAIHSQRPEKKSPPANNPQHPKERNKDQATQRDSRQEMVNNIQENERRSLGGKHLS